MSFRSMKSLLDTRPIFHKCDETIRGHVFCSFLALLLRKEPGRPFGAQGVEAGMGPTWSKIWTNLVEMEVAISGKGYVFRGQTSGVAARFFQSLRRGPATRACAHAEPLSSSGASREKA